MHGHDAAQGEDPPVRAQVPPFVAGVVGHFDPIAGVYAEVLRRPGVQEDVLRAESRRRRSIRHGQRGPTVRSVGG